MSAEMKPFSEATKASTKSRRALKQNLSSEKPFPFSVRDISEKAYPRMQDRDSELGFGYLSEMKLLKDTTASSCG